MRAVRDNDEPAPPEVPAGVAGNLGMIGDQQVIDPSCDPLVGEQDALLDQAQDARIHSIPSMLITFGNPRSAAGVEAPVL